MRANVRRGLIVIGVFLALPGIASAQEATVTGTVTDTTGGVLPGVAVTAVHEASGNTFASVTDERGTYRIPVRTGVYRLTGELAGFATINRTGFELLVGQQAVVNLQMEPSGLQESVMVTGEAPIIDTTNSALGGTIDPRQVSELPLNDRNWVDLTMLASGSRANAIAETPTTGSGTFQLNIDGQQVTQTVAYGFGQPRAIDAVGGPRRAKRAKRHWQPATGAASVCDSMGYQGQRPVAGRLAIDGIAEVFNLFNHANYGSYTTQESNRQYGKPSQNINVAYAPHMLQLGFRLAF